MKIILTGNTGWSLYNFRGGLISALLREGHNITVIAPKDDFSARLANLGCNVVNVPMSSKGINPFEDIVLTMRLTKIYRKVRPDFIFHYTIKPNIYGSIAAWLNKIPSIAVTTGLGYTFINRNWVSSVSRFLYRVALKSAKEIWFLNNDDLKMFREHNIVKASKTCVLPGEGVDTQHFSPLPSDQTEDKLSFLLVARMLWDKGVGEFVEAARQIKRRHANVSFLLLGDCGSDNPAAIDRNKVEEWEKEGVIQYLGTTTDVRPFIRSADCIVLPSYREGIPRALLEASAMGKPVVATNVAGCRDVVIEGKTGLLCQAKDSEALVECLTKVLMMTDECRKAMGNAGREYILNTYDERKIVSHYVGTLARYGMLDSVLPRSDDPLDDENFSLEV